MKRYERVLQPSRFRIQVRMDGFVISDLMGIDMITDPPHANYAYMIEQSVGAGVDM
ncbi:glycoside hydrolase family 3 C-terminal domain-containing protein, partial [Tanacetum coccineum]